MVCPFCGSEMYSGILHGDGRCAVRWEGDGDKTPLLEQMLGKCRVDAAKYSFGRFSIRADYCLSCKKMIFDTGIEDWNG